MDTTVKLRDEMWEKLELIDAKLRVYENHYLGALKKYRGEARREANQNSRDQRRRDREMDQQRRESGAGHAGLIPDYDQQQEQNEEKLILAFALAEGERLIKMMCRHTIETMGESVVPPLDPTSYDGIVRHMESLMTSIRRAMMSDLSSMEWKASSASDQEPQIDLEKRTVTILKRGETLNRPAFDQLMASPVLASLPEKELEAQLEERIEVLVKFLELLTKRQKEDKIGEQI